MDVRVTQLRGFLATDPTNINLACDLADALCAQAEYAQADAVLRGLPDGETAPGPAFRLARIDLIHGRHAQAEAGYRGLIEHGHDNLAIRHDLAFAQLCQRHVDDAAATVEAALARFEPAPALFVLKGRIELMRERYDEAVDALDRALQLDPDDEAAQGVRALALFDASRFEEAAVAARDCLLRYPEQHEALLVAGTMSLWQSDLDSAQALFERGLQRHPNSGRALSGYGQLQMLRNDLPAARDTLHHAVVAMPDHIGTWHALAWTQLLQNDRDAAETSYRKAYELDRNFGDTHGGLALIDALRGDYDAAEQGIKRALRLDPQAVTARYAKTLVLEARGENAAADALMGELMPGSPLPVHEFAQRLKATLGIQPR
ncbi:tetratricopeptide repeat protein [Lysobacter capsici]|uniref:tetratricopeptide repeat protein n=1 Tax=Lysobacter capsici TaxID=435897 RepID=UPI00177ACC19|nr:tetratricopeptide repeat protein [Lysobacter capsici]UOF16279.1 tetratricopeptide repeat protein [Lysobacter capsici]